MEVERINYETMELELQGDSQWDYDFWILGEPASAKNARQMVTIHGKPRLIKSKKALSYAKAFDSQCPIADPILEGDIALWIDVYYKSRRPDLACVDFIQDLLQEKIYLNDRQVKASGSLWNLDRENPRVRVRVREIPLSGCTEMSSCSPLEIWGREAMPSKQT